MLCWCENSSSNPRHVTDTCRKQTASVLLQWASWWTMQVATHAPDFLTTQAHFVEVVACAARRDTK